MVRMADLDAHRSQSFQARRDRRKQGSVSNARIPLVMRRVPNITQSEIAAFIWSVADLLRGDYKQSDYGKVILPLTLLRRLDCALEPTKPAVLAEYERRKGSGLDLDLILPRVSGVGFYNISSLDVPKLLDDPANLHANLVAYIGAFSEHVRDIFDHYDFLKEVETLDRANLLYQVVQRFAAVDLHPAVVSNADMGIIFEELIRRFAELSNETAGEHYTPREVIRLMVDLLFIADDAVLRQPGTNRSVYDPAAGTGGMLTAAEEHLHQMNPGANLAGFGQELNAESYAICKADMLMKGHDVSHIILGNTLSHDGLAGQTFDYGLSNPPFGVDWKKVEKEVREEHERQGFHGRFGPGLPRISDGSMLFLLHLIAKLRPPDQGGGRMAIVLNGSPLFTGGAGSGECEIRRWILEHDLVEAIVALPTDMFYNTGIATYIWVLSNRKDPHRQGNVQLINAVDFFHKMRKSLGAKRKELGPEDIARIVQLYGEFAANEHSKIFATTDFGYRTITVERPLRLNFAVTADRLDRLDDVSPLKKLNGSLEALKRVLANLGADRVWTDRTAFIEEVLQALAGVGIRLPAAQTKALIHALGDRDESAEICRDAKGEPEPDPELRDTENVPLAEDVEAYFARDVLPYVPGAWIDYPKTKVGYEIPFTRHFYEYVPPRPLEEIEKELADVGQEIARLMKALTQ